VRAVADEIAAADDVVDLELVDPDQGGLQRRRLAWTSVMTASRSIAGASVSIDRRRFNRYL
jgi:hypothetical protein